MVKRSRHRFILEVDCTVDDQLDEKYWASLWQDAIRVHALSGSPLKACRVMTIDQVTEGKE